MNGSFNVIIAITAIFCTAIVIWMIWMFWWIFVKSGKDAEKIRKAKEEEERQYWESLSEEEKEKKLREQEAEKIQRTIDWTVSIHKLPKYCPSCGELNYEYKPRYALAVPLWVLDSTSISSEERFDGGTRIGGSTTFYTQTHQRKTETYRCPSCGYKHQITT